jgi:DNA-binding transcriptional regulator/RsmH inhibitor MraZ
MYPARLDDKGRLKLPVVFQQYFANLREKRLFVTSVDRQTALVYPMQRWREVEAVLDGPEVDPQAARNVAFTAAELGSEAEMDGQGRILFSPELRRELAIENQPVRLRACGGHVEVLSEKIFEEQKQEAKKAPQEDLAKVRAARAKC